MPQKDAPKKTSVSKLAKEKHVRIIKHFQPISYSKEHRNYELPEVDNDIDVQEYLNKVTNHQRFTYQERKPKNTKEIYTKNEKITKSTIITRKRNKRGILDNTEPSSKSQSSLENVNHTIEIPKPFLTRKSKSFSVNRKPSNQISRQIDKNKSKNILISSSSPNFNENYVTNLKREISQSRCKTADAWLDTKLYLMHKNEIHNEKVRHLREEISKLINIDLEERKKHVTELKTEIAEFKRNDYIAVYNVETHTNTEIESENDVKTDETNKSSTTSVEETSKEENSDIEMVDMKAVAALREIEEETNEQEIRSTDLTIEVPVEEKEKPTCEKLCLLEDKNAANAGVVHILGQNIRTGWPNVRDAVHGSAALFAASINI